MINWLKRLILALLHAASSKLSIYVYVLQWQHQTTPPTVQELEDGTLAEWSVSGCQMTDLARTSSPRTRRGSRALQAQK